jgi:hypothetical protein
MGHGRHRHGRDAPVEQDRLAATRHGEFTRSGPAARTRKHDRPEERLCSDTRKPASALRFRAGVEQRRHQRKAVLPDQLGGISADPGGGLARQASDGEPVAGSSVAERKARCQQAQAVEERQEVAGKALRLVYLGGDGNDVALDHLGQGSEERLGPGRNRDGCFLIAVICGHGPMLDAPRHDAHAHGRIRPVTRVHRRMSNYLCRNCIAGVLMARLPLDITPAMLPAE